MNHVYALAADMGGMGYISANHATILYNNATINFNTMEGARVNKVSRYFYSSSACIYPEYRQTKAKMKPLKEEDAFPAQPQDAYGWEKLVDIISEIAGVELKKIHVAGPQGVRGRNSDNSKLRKVLKWEPGISLEQGLVKTYQWIEEQVSNKLNK